MSRFFQSVLIVWGSLVGTGWILPALAQPAPSRPAELELKMVTGSEAGQYHRLGQDLETLLRQYGLDLDPIPTQGSLENIQELYNHPSIVLGFSQLDVLALLPKLSSGDSELRQQVDSLRIVLPLYRETVHLVSRSPIASLRDLAGKRVSLGDAGSGTSITAATLLRTTGVAPASLRYLPTSRAILALRQGEIDAFFLVSGTPDPALTTEVQAQDGFRLLPVTLPRANNDEFLSQIYQPTTVAVRTYPWQSEAVPSLTVGSAILTTADANCNQISPFVTLVATHLDQLKQTGSPLWKSVNRDRPAGLMAKRLSACVPPTLP
ncbi:MAG: TAXI family TRAP transporter solute-binding subunit [Gloeomargaritaceae cyanobacterium C42_A2020_066]|nr:TAXI family TRAP transporter solute-binding subunit [Gloeomargaritaceae cyanobacterium C42_A2020_066]